MSSGRDEFHISEMLYHISEPVINLLITYCNPFDFSEGLFCTYGNLFGPSLNQCK